MSYDLQIWSVHSASAPEGLPTPTTWKANDQSWIHERRDWQVVLGRSLKVLPEDVPETVAQTLPGIAYLTELNLSPGMPYSLVLNKVQFRATQFAKLSLRSIA
jgi:hypothetical protein